MQAIGAVILFSVLVVVVIIAVAVLSALTGKLDGVDDIMTMIKKENE